MSYLEALTKRAAEAGYTFERIEKGCYTPAVTLGEPEPYTAYRFVKDGRFVCVVAGLPDEAHALRVLSNEILCCEEERWLSKESL